jgi:hypothetical protein
MKKIVSGLLVLFLFACSDSKNKNDPDNNVILGSQLEGSWRKACDQYSSSNSGNSIINFAKGEAEIIGRGYRSSDCSGGLDVETVFKMTYVADGTESAHVQGAKHIDLTMAQVTLTYYSKDYVEINNMLKFCGFEDWKIGVTKDVTGLKCETELFPAAGEVRYDIYKITGKNLSVGAEWGTYDGSTPEKRPIILSSQIYTRE